MWSKQMRAILLAAIAGTPLFLGAQEQLRSRQVYSSGGELQSVVVRARDDGYVEIRSTHTSLRGECLLRPEEAKVAAGRARSQFGAAVRLGPGEEVVRRSEPFGLVCPIRIEETLAAGTSELRVLHDVPAGLTIRTKIPNLPRFTDALLQAAAITDSMTPVPARTGVQLSIGQDQPYFDFQVDAPAAPARNSEGPRYPDILRSGGIEGEVIGQFIVDTLGRVEIASFRVLRSTHTLFEQSVRAALPGLRFLPAELQGRKVRQLVQQPFTFDLKR
ncbi:MAG: hypothetical protein C0503_02815 [Gemmatimonas sp.]|nr:hypothetical protein [Gemmatimonas sp.]